MDNMLFDLGSTYSYVSMRFASEFDIVCDIFEASMFLPKLESLS